MRRLTLTLSLLALLLGGLALTPGVQADDRALITELLDGTDDVNRGESSISVMTMYVKTERYERTVTMKSWTKGTEKSLIVIQSPAKEKGTATLKVDDNIWNYLPKIDRTMKVPANMMSGAWQGSHISNNDLVRENRLSEEFDYTLTERPEGEAGKYVIELVPKPDAPVVWGKVVVDVGVDRVPQQMRYFDEQGDLVRTLAYSEVQEIAGRKVPMQMTVTPADKPGEMTRITFEEMQFDVDIPDSTFFLQALRR